MLFLLTTWTLDIIFGATWWVVSKTSNGIYYILYGRNNKGNIVELAKTDNESSKKIIEDLLEETKKQKEEIKKLNENISVLSDYMKQQLAKSIPTEKIIDMNHSINY